MATFLPELISSVFLVPQLVVFELPQDVLCIAGFEMVESEVVGIMPPWVGIFRRLSHE